MLLRWLQALLQLVGRSGVVVDCHAAVSGTSVMTPGGAEDKNRWLVIKACLLASQHQILSETATRREKSGGIGGFCLLITSHRENSGLREGMRHPLEPIDGR